MVVYNCCKKCAKLLVGFLGVVSSFCFFCCSRARKPALLSGALRFDAIGGGIAKLGIGGAEVGGGVGATLLF